MAIPRASENAANDVQGWLDAFDRDLVDWIVDGGIPPDRTRLFDIIAPLVAVAVSAAILEIDPDATDAEIDRAVANQVAAIRTAVNVSFRRAQRLRRQVPDQLPEQDDGESFAAFARRVGAAAALAVAARGLTTRQRRQTAQVEGVSLPRPTAAYGRMVVRTGAAIERNQHTAQVVARRNLEQGARWVVYVRDGLLGPTDEGCERVDRRYATVEWARNHPVEHPNCTREMRPMVLPEGERVTLLR